MVDKTPARSFRFLTGYYGILQSIHFLLLARAGSYLLRGHGIPFPAPPPPGGWPEPALPFLVGMGAADVLAIVLGLIFAYHFLFKDQIQTTLGLISLTAAISSGIIYLIGTLPSGAWGANPLAYLAVIILFSPVLLLFYYLIMHTSKDQ